MKKTKLPAILALALVLVFLFAIAGTAENVQPGITISDVSLRLDGENLGLRFVSDVKLPLPDGARITEQGTLIVPLYVNGYNEFTRETTSTVTVLKSENKIYSAKANQYQFAATLEGIPVYHLASPICARSFITYTVGNESFTVYSEIEVYDAYSLAKADSNFQSVVSQYDAYVDSIKDENKDISDSLTVTIPVADDGKVYLYADDAKAYLLATDEYDKTGSVSALSAYTKYVSTTNEVAKGVEITWEDTVQGAKSYTVMYATDENFSDAKFAWSTTGDECKVTLYNLYKGTEYYVKVIANHFDEISGSYSTRVAKTATFETSDLGPRVIYLDGPHNARDLGGYVVGVDEETGEKITTMQGLLYRSGKFNFASDDKIDASISDFGQYLVRSDLKLKTELDLREGYSQTLDCPNYFRVYTRSYDLANTAWKTTLPAIFKVLADINNYPIVFHCQGGADRTGTVAYLINGLLGVSDLDLAHDYEFTSFSWYGLRYMNSTDYIKNPEHQFFETLNLYGDETSTTQQKVEAYLLANGVTAEQIANVKSIMLTGQPATTQD